MKIKCFELNIVPIYLLSLILFASTSVFGQTKFVSYNTLSPSNGLSHITVNSLYQDSRDAIWIASRDGLNCYDGTSVKVYRKDFNRSKSLSSSNIGQIVGDLQGHIYLSCNDGVWLMDIATEEFSLITDKKVDAIVWSDGLYIAVDNQIFVWDTSRATFIPHLIIPIPQLQISSMLFDHQGRLFVGTQEHGLYQYEDDGTFNQLLTDVGVLSIMEHRNGGLWIGTASDGLYCIDGNSGSQVTHFTPDDGQVGAIPSLSIRDISQDDEGSIWLATDNGVACYIPEEQSFKHYYSVESSSSVWAILCDKQGNIWCGSYFGGVNWFNPQDNVFSHFNMIDAFRSTLEDTVIGRMVEDCDGLLWICTEGRGVYIYNRESGIFSPLLDSQGQAAVGKNIKSVYYDQRNEVMWFGSHLDGLYRYDIATRQVKNYRYDPSQRWSLPSNIIRDIAPYEDALILATPNGVALFDPTTGNSEMMFIDTAEGRRITPVSNVMLDQNNTLWIGTEGAGLFTYNFSQKSLTNYNQQGASGLSSNNISTIIEDERGVVWIGHEGSGVDRFDAEAATFTNFDRRSAGLVGNRIYEICDNLDSTLTISTGEGLSLFNTETLQCYNYSPQSGYTLLSPNENAMVRSGDGIVFIGGIDGLVSLDLHRLRNIQRREYKLRFTSLYVNQKLISPADSTQILPQILPNLSQIVLPSNTSSMRIGLTTSNYIVELNEPLEYRLEGFDHEWISLQGDMIAYTNIPAGNYTLRLRTVSRSSSVESIALKIKILSVWYRSKVAYLLYLLLAATVIYYLLLLYRQRVRLSEQVKYEQDRILGVEQQNHLKLQFFTNISHEFRTPLSVIIGQIELLLRSDQIGGVDRRKVHSIYRSSKELNLLISELLDFRKHEQGRLTLNIQEADVSEMIEELYDIYAEHISSKEVNLKLTLPEDNEPVMLNCDITQLRKVVTNLLSNAIKYTTKGDLISLILEDSDNSTVIRVEDSGQGIPTSDLQHIFDRFYQGLNSKSSSMGGTGIGLSFAKGIVELHGGTISVDSRLGSGSWFSVVIPHGLELTGSVKQEIKAQAAPIYIPENVESTELVAERINNKRVTMLAVEDDEQLLKILVELFEGQYNVITATNGREGVDMAREYLPQIIVSDVMMPEVSGIELCRELKGDLLTSHIPIVLLTARGATEHAVEGMNCGADDYIIKPFNVDLMVARCNNIINNRLLLQQKYSQKPEVMSVKMATNALDQQILEKAVAIIDRHIDDPDFDIATFASEIAMSRTNLFAKIKAVTGLTPNDYILTVRLKRAAALLRGEPTLPIVEVAERVGFSGHRYFSKRFKDKFGVTPGAYRQGDDAQD